MFMRRFKLNSAGDTIIEVLLALAVLASVLGGAYVSSNRSLSGARDAQERGEALKLVEEQLERLRAVVKTLPNNTTPFCLIDSSPSAYKAQSSLDLNNDNLTAYQQPECVNQ